jgi:hypothetical protein
LFIAINNEKNEKHRPNQFGDKQRQRRGVLLAGPRAGRGGNTPPFEPLPIRRNRIIICAADERLTNMGKKSTPTGMVTVSVRLSSTVRQALAKAAKNEMRTISGYLQYRRADLLRKEGFLKGQRQAP